LSPADSSGGQSTDQSGSTIGLKYSWVVELLPFIGNQNIYDAWDFSNTPATAAGLGGNRGSYLDATPSTAKRGNADLANTYIEVLVCPADITVQEGTGAISYVVNGGFDAHWILKTDFTNAQYSEPDSFMCLKSGWHRDNLRQMGLMFLDTTQGGTDARRRHSLDSIRDGVSFTVALSENINVGPGSVAGLVTNWACPYPQNTSFFVNPQAVLGGGFPNSPGNVMPGEPGRYRYIDSNNRGNLAAGDYDPIAGGTTSSNPCYVTYGDSSGVYNQGGINGDLTGIAEGNYPYPNSLHPGGVHVVMADGSARFIPENIAGDVWARLVTPNGSLLTRGGGKARDRLNFEEAPSGITDPDLYPLGNRQIPLSDSEIP
jgi:prepilin-type processing-associated H-X9-DG protein